MLSFEIPEGYRLDFQEYLFNTEQHRLTQAKKGWKSFYWLDKKKRLVKASFHVHVEKGIARSPYRATFGGIDFSGRLSQRHLTEFINQFSLILKKEGAFQIQIINAPQSYWEPGFSMLFQAMIENAYVVEESSVDSCIKIHQSHFSGKLDKANRKRLKRIEGLKFKQESRSELLKVYELIDKSRRAKQYQLSLSYGQVEKLASEVSESFLIFGVYSDDILVAGAICIRVSSKVLYLFYADHLKEYEADEPSIFLYSSLYDFCLQNNFELLDLGTSVENGQTKFSLLEFKQSIGGEPSLKLTFYKRLNE